MVVGTEQEQSVSYHRADVVAVFGLQLSSYRQGHDIEHNCWQRGNRVTAVSQSANPVALRGSRLRWSYRYAQCQ
jgi:hypothetical protein